MASTTAGCGGIPSRRQKKLGRPAACSHPVLLPGPVGLVLSGSVYLIDFPQHFRLLYLPAPGAPVLEITLPTVSILRHVSKFDATERRPRRSSGFSS